MRKKPRIELVDTSSALKDHITAIYKIECHFCGHRETLDTTDGKGFIDTSKFCKFWFEAGWKIVTSKKYQVIAPACPACAKIKDKDR
jgi:hypothetical protein